MRRRTDDRKRPRGAVAAWVLPPLLTVALAVAVVPSVLRHPLPDTPPLGQRWMATPTTVGRVRAIDPDVAALFFDRSPSYVLAGGSGVATSVVGWSDERRFEEDLDSGAIPAGVRLV